MDQLKVVVLESRFVYWSSVAGPVQHRLLAWELCFRVCLWTGACSTCPQLTARLMLSLAGELCCKDIPVLQAPVWLSCRCRYSCCSASAADVSRVVADASATTLDTYVRSVSYVQCIY